jgi:AraC-like DNA-binding protein
MIAIDKGDLAAGAIFFMATSPLIRFWCDDQRHARRTEYHWTLQQFGRAWSAAMSRSTFALRFNETVGVSPMEYLTCWRMLVAGTECDPIHKLMKQMPN